MFIVDYINRMKVCTPTPSRSSSSSSFNLTSMTTIKNTFFQPRFLDTLQDQHLFNWSYTRDFSQFFSKSGATTPSLQSRSSSFSAEGEVTSFSIEHVYHIRKDE